MRTAVQQVLAFQIDLAGQIAAAGKRCRTAGVVGKQIAKLGLKARIVLRIEKRRLELLQCRHQDFGSIGPAEPTEPAI